MCLQKTVMAGLPGKIFPEKQRVEECSLLFSPFMANLKDEKRRIGKRVKKEGIE